MLRKYEPVDLMVAVGLCATVLGVCFLFMAVNGTLQAAIAPGDSIELSAMGQDGLSSVQPAIGQALVEHSSLGREAFHKNAEAVTELNRATVRQYWLQDSIGRSPGVFRDDAVGAAADHEGRVQTVLGNLIVNFTQRGVRSSLFASALSAAEFNNRLLGVLETTKMRMDADFLANWQPNLGRAIVAETLDRVNVSGPLQERIGRAIVRVARNHADYEEAQARSQEQLGSLIAAMARIRNSEEAPRQTSPESVIEPRTWPEIPAGYLIAACTGLIGLFFAGLLLPTRRTEELTEHEITEGVKVWVYRKTA
jgi:hypothetical protein